MLHEKAVNARVLKRVIIVRTLNMKASTTALRYERSNRGPRAE
jgi:hypothetical protein